MRKTIVSISLAIAAVIMFGSAASAQRFVAAFNSAQQIPPNNSTARATCTMFLSGTAAGQTPSISLACQFSGLSSGLTAVHLHGGAPAGQEGSVAINLIGASGTTGGSFISAEGINLTPANLADLRAKRLYLDFHTQNFPNGEIRGQIKLSTLDFDVDGDGRTDPIVYRPSNATSYALRSTNGDFVANRNGGGLTDSPVIYADLDGDGLADSGYIRINPVNGVATTFYTGTRVGARSVTWGNLTLGDIPAPSDYDADGSIDIAVYRQSNGFWYILQSSNNQARIENWGLPNVDTPCPGDYDGDGRTDLCITRAESNQTVWYIRRSSDSQTRRIVWGLVGDTTYPGFPFDVDGDGATDVLVSRVMNGQMFYYALRSSDNSLFALQWGLSTDGVRFGDYDGDGKTDFAALRTINNQLFWFVNQSSNGQTRSFVWGTAGDQ